MVQIQLTGLSHRTAPLHLREQLALSEDELVQTLRQLLECGHREAAVLSTCNRLEVYTVGEGDVLPLLASRCDLAPEQLAPHIYTQTGQDAIIHLMRVAAGTDSMILGEQQILGQVQLALDTAYAAGAAGPVLSHLFSRAAHAGKRARHETEISRHTTSISHAAVQLARSQLGDLRRVKALVIGSGEMATLAAQALHRHDTGRLICINRTAERAQTLAAQFGAETRDWAALPGTLAEVDLVITATGAPHAIIQPEQIQSPLVIVDIALPRDVDARVSDLPDVRYYDLDHIKAFVEANLARREAALTEVDAIITEETANFNTWMRGWQVAPVVTALRDKAAAVAQNELETALRRLGDLDESQQQVVQLLAHRIVNKILHEPTTRMKDDTGYAAAVQALFALDIDGE